MRRGHDVTLFASGDSVTSADLVSVCPANLRDFGGIDASNWDRACIWHILNAVACFERASDFDIIHNHIGTTVMPICSLVGTPVLTTMHGAPPQDPASIEELAAVWSSYRGYYNTVSRSAKAGWPDQGYVGAVSNAIDYESYPLGQKGQGYLLALSAIAPRKGIHTAVEVARRAQRRLIVAGNVQKGNEGYFRRYIEPFVDNQLISYFGEANTDQKKELYAGADCLLFPVQWDEPFGLVMIEAMACGAPVIAFDRGAVREVMADGETGFIVEDVDGMVQALTKIDSIDRRRCREHVEHHFGVARMADDYLALYQRMLDQGE